MYIKLFYIFFKIGLFSVGGGLATFPLLYDEMVLGGYVSEQEFIDMVAVSQSTPGPIGINMATYVGYKVGGVGGSFLATAAMAAPSFLIVVLIASFVRDFNKNYYIRALFRLLRGLSVGLIAAAAWFVFAASVVDTAQFPHGTWFNPRWVLLFLLLAIISWRFKKIHPLVIIVCGAFAGVFLL